VVTRTASSGEWAPLMVGPNEICSAAKGNMHHHLLHAFHKMPTVVHGTQHIPMVWPNEICRSGLGTR
jgi:hypothetical protein